MTKHIWSLLCRKSTVDKETNNLSLFEVFEQLEVNVSLTQNLERINIPIDYEVVNFLQKDNKDTEEKINLKFEIISPEEQKIKTFEHLIIIPKNLMRMRVQNRIKGIEIIDSGIYTYKIYLKQLENKDYKLVAEIPLEVKLNKQIKTSSKKEKESLVN